MWALALDVFDVGEYGMGRLASSIEPNTDAPSNATLLDATYAGDDPERFLRLFALPVELYFPAAGAVPLVVGGAVAGVLAVSGLSGEEDHDLAVDALRELGATHSGAAERHSSE